MITKAQVKHIQSLDAKKSRQEHQQFVVEGEKMLEELLKSDFKVITIFALKPWIQEHADKFQEAELLEVELFELERISFLKTPNQVLAIAKMVPKKPIPTSAVSLVLDDIQDPGNLGSIIRIADWYGISSIYCSEKCVDQFNTKVVQATMGSVFRVQCIVCDLEQLLLENKHIHSYAAVLGGKNINEFNKIESGFIIIGNESKGIHKALSDACNYKISIHKKGLAESLNAAVATGIICHTLLS